jgi:hypothetical protein
MFVTASRRKKLIKKLSTIFFAVTSTYYFFVETAFRIPRVTVNRSIIVIVMPVIFAPLKDIAYHII